MTGKRINYFGVLLLLLIVGLAGCGGGSNTAAGADTAAVSGTMDGTLYASSSIGYKAFFAKIFGTKKAFAGAGTVTRIVDIAQNGYVKEFVNATLDLTTGSFTINLERGKSYLLVFFDVTTPIAILSLDTTKSLEALPLSMNAQDLSLGTVSDSLASTASGKMIFKASTPTATLLTSLGYDSTSGAALSDATAGLIRLCSADVDKNGIFDWEEGKNFDLFLNYFHASEQLFSTLVSGGDKSQIAYRGYMYYFSGPDSLTTAAKWHVATLLNTGNINGAASEINCWDAVYNSYRILNFYCGGAATSPDRPPEGTFIVNYYDNLSDTGFLKSLTFTDVRSRAITFATDGANSKIPINVLIPVPTLTLVDGKVTKIDFVFWVHNGTAWEQATDALVNEQIDYAGFEIGDALWSSSSRVLGRLFADRATLTATGSVTPGTQGFTPGSLNLSYRDKSGFSYYFEWRTPTKT